MNVHNTAAHNITASGVSVIRYLLKHRQATKAQLTEELHLSAPTITSVLHDLERRGIVNPGPLLKSTGGRKARTHCFNPHHRTAVSATIRRHTLELAALDLNGTVISSASRAMPYRNIPTYWQRAYHAMDEFAQAMDTHHGTVLGIALTYDGIPEDDMPGIPGGTTSQRDSTADSTTENSGQIATSTAVPHTRLPLQRIRPCDAAAIAELWHDRTLANALFLYLDRTPSCTVALAGHIANESNAEHLTPPPNDAIAHMTLVPQGRSCRCGRLGCMAAYCSPESLPEDYESIPGFFSVLEQGETHHRERMNEWLGWVALVVSNLRRVIPADIIIAGEAAQYLDDDDIAELHSRVRQLQPPSLQDFTLRAGLTAGDLIGEGAALLLIRRYLDALVSAEAEPAQAR